MNQYGVERSVRFLESWLAYQGRQGVYPGFSIAVYLKDRKLFSGAYGYANLETRERLTKKHFFSIGSQSKMLTAQALLHLTSLKTVSLSDRVVDYLPWLQDHRDDRMKTITLWQLLRHEAGLARDISPADFWQLQTPFPDEVSLRKSVLESSFYPSRAARFKYSNVGYALLGLVIEAASGQSYRGFVEHSLLRPERLDIVSCDDQLFGGELAERQYAKGYIRQVNGERLPVSVYVPTVSYTPVAGWFATPETMCRFLSNRWHEYSQETGASSHAWWVGNQHWRPAEQRGTRYGLGVMAYEYGPYQLRGHSGSFIGHNSYSFIDVRSGLTVSVMANAKDAPAEYIGEGIFGVFDYFEQYGSEVMPPQLERLNARLMNLWQTIEIVATSDRIVSVDPDSWAPFEHIVEEFERMDPRQLKITETSDLAMLDEKVEFYFTKEGKIDRVSYGGSTTYTENKYLASVQKMRA